MFVRKNIAIFIYFATFSLKIIAIFMYFAMF